MAALVLRDYQQVAVDSIHKYFGVSAGNPVLELPTSAGKSLIQADFITDVFERWPGQRILCLAHVQELIEQNYLELLSYWPGAPAGINAASMNRRDTHDPILFAMIQSVFKSAPLIGFVDLVIIDECHLVPVRTADGMYRTFLEALRQINPAVKVIGLSATPYRLDNGMLNEGDNRIFTDIIPAKANGASIDDLLAAGYLSPLVVPEKGVRTRLAIDGVKKTGGDYNQKQLAAAVDVDETTQAAVAEIVEHGAERGSWLVFATSVAHAEHIKIALGFWDVVAEVLTGETPRPERRKLTEDFKSGVLRCLISINALTTGFNARCTSLIAFMRPTASTNLYVQMAGRGMRLSPETGKTNCLILDFAGLIDKHGPVNDVTPPAKRGKGNGEAPIKECEQCFMLIPAGSMTCKYCGYEFPPPLAGHNINETASTSAIITGQAERDAANAPKRREIANVTYAVHHKTGSPSMLKVVYWEGEGLLRIKAATEYQCLFHSGTARLRAIKWWNEFVDSIYHPGDVLQAAEFARKYGRAPDYIYTKPDGKYTSVVSRGFNPIEVAVNGN